MGADDKGVVAFLLESPELVRVVVLRPLVDTCSGFFVLVLDVEDKARVEVFDYYSSRDLLEDPTLVESPVL